MSLYDRAKADIERITSNKNEWGKEIIFTSLNGVEANISGVHAKIYLGVDMEGNMVSSKKAHVSVSEKFLTDLSYPVRTAGGDVDMINHRVDVKDSTGEIKNYSIQKSIPDETIGLLSFILVEYEED